MSERRMIVNNLVLAYEGLLDAGEFFKFIDDWFKKNGYEKQEVRHVERVKEKGKYIDFEVMPYKEVSEYTRYEIDVRTIMENLTDTKIKKDKQEFKMNKGKVTIAIDAFLATDREGHWEHNAFLFFIRTLFDKFVHKTYMERFEKGLTDDVQDLHSEMKSYFNLNKYTTGS